MKHLLALLALMTPASAGEVTLEWDHQDNVNYHVWVDGKVVATSPVNSATIPIEDDSKSIITITAFTSEAESGHSPAILVLPLVVQYSEDLIEWTTLVVIPLQAEMRGFYRLLPPP